MTFINLLFSPLSFILISIVGFIACAIKSFTVTKRKEKTKHALLTVFFFVTGLWHAAMAIDAKPTYDQRTDTFSNETPEQAAFRRAMEQLQREANRL